jgi:hypothetical protein
MILMELIKKHLLENGIQETVAVQVTINNAETLLIANDSHPALQREIGEGQATKIAIVQLAHAGLSGGVFDRFMDFEPEDIVDRQRRHRLILTPEMMDDLMNNPENDLFEA